MTNTEMLYEFRLGADIIASNAAPGFTDTQVYALLNRSQDYIILDLYNKKNYLLLEELIKDHPNGVVTGFGNKIYGIALPADYWLYIESHTYLTRTAITSTGFIPANTIITQQQFKNDLISPEDSINFLPTVFNNYRAFKNPKCYIADGVLYSMVDDLSTVGNISLRYIKKRLSISSINNCELQESLHRPIVDKAIDTAKVIFNIQEPQQSST